LLVLCPTRFAPLLTTHFISCLSFFFMEGLILHKNKGNTQYWAELNDIFKKIEAHMNQVNDQGINYPYWINISY
jgi:hypothetical protein